MGWGREEVDGGGVVERSWVGFLKFWKFMKEGIWGNRVKWRRLLRGF